ncbi:hypothetical protein KY308_01740 [Candidatus Woesearchaeota archaeon]|nr:hypothetical protein [Candidatus Woesearchaeota archaeon]
MPGKIDLSEKGLRKKLNDIAAEFSDENLKEASEKGCIDTISLVIAESPNVRDIINQLFSGFDNSDELVSGLLQYEDGPYFMKNILKRIGRAAFFSRDADTVARVAKAMGLKATFGVMPVVGGRLSKDFMDLLSVAAYLSKDDSTCEIVAEVGYVLKGVGNAFSDAVKDLSETAYLTRSPAAITIAAKKYLPVKEPKSAKE